MPVRSIKSTSIIKGSDGPTAIFLAGTGHKEKNPIRRMKRACQNYRWQKRRKKAEQQIVPCAHSVQETIAYLCQTYEAEEKAAALPEDLFPIDYHIYLIDRGTEGFVEVEIEMTRGIVGISSSENQLGKKPWRHSNKMSAICRDIYRYYGVTAEDIAAKTERYKTLVTALADWK